MGDAASSERLYPELQLFVHPSSITIPATPDNTPEESMSEPTSDQTATVTPPKLPGSTNTNNIAGATAGTINADVSYDHETPVLSIEDEEVDIFASLEPDAILAIPITNPSAFPIQRIQEVQSQHYPSTYITNMLCHKTRSGPITQVTADIQDGSVNHLLIRDQRLISALGLAPPDFDTITLDTNKLKIDETFMIRILPGQRPQKLDEWIMASLESARHAYLYWLDERRTADPIYGPYAAESKAIARKTRRRWPDVLREIEAVWKLEQGDNGKHYRENRMRYLGEDPTYPEGAEDGRMLSMFG
ncbi:hypothetical protein EJ07DRAFT_177052 [Lizonia empirigonia]|nr:hypothetical protein EJ07DRAFT_177052 [Lizonia empirigonia]